MELVPKAEFSIVTRASQAWIPELITAAGPEKDVTDRVKRGQSTNLDRKSDSRERLDVRAGNGGQVDCRESRPEL
jgi:hypothetical protein